MKFYGGLPKEEVLKAYIFIMQKRKELGYGQRKLFWLVKKELGVEINENTLAGWIFRKIVPFKNEKTQFKAKPKPKKDELSDLYLYQQLSAEKIARKYHVSTIIVINWLRSYGIKTRSHKESMNTENVRNELREKRLRRPTKDFSFLSSEKAYILGVLCGDAYITREFISFEIRYDKDFIKEFAECFEKVYGLKYRYSYYALKNTLKLNVSNQLICEDLLGYGKFRTENWDVPREILKSNDEKIIGAFLRGFYDSEGSTSSRSSISCSSINKNGLEQIKNLLKKIGIESTLCSCDGGRYYVLHIFRKERFKIFREKVGFNILRKLDKLNETLNTGFFSKRSVA